MKKRLVLLLLTCIVISTIVLADDDIDVEEALKDSDDDEWFQDWPKYEGDDDWEDRDKEWFEDWPEEDYDRPHDRPYDERDYRGPPRDMRFRDDEFFDDDMYMPEPPIDEFIDDPESYMQYCDDPEHMVDLLIGEMESKGAFEDMFRGCDDIKKDMQQCYEEDHCENIQQDHDERDCNIHSVDELMDQCMENIYHDAEQMQDNIDQMTQDEEDDFMDDMIEQMQEEIDEMIDHGKERCEQYAQEDVDMMERQCEDEQERMEEYQERDYERCKDEQEYHCSRMEEAVEQCESHMNMDEIKQEMIKEGKRICDMYGKHKPFMDIMRMMKGDHRDRMGQEMRRIAETEESLKSIESNEDKSFMKKVMEFLGFAKEEIIQDAHELREAANELDVTITTLRELQGSVDEATSEALQQEIDRLQHERDKLYKQSEKYEQRASGFVVIVGDAVHTRRW